jgi:hypothetical protein
MPTLGDAFIDVHADMSPFRREVRAAMARMSKDVEQDVDKQGNAIGRRLGQRIRESMAQGVGTGQISRDAVIDLETRLDRTSAARTEVAIARVARDREVNIRVDRRSVDQVQSLGDALAHVFRRTFTSIDRIFSSIIDIGERVPGSGFAIMTVLIAGVTELIGLVGFATDALLGLASTLPLLGLVGAASIAPLVLVFSNLGDAFSTLGGDADEFRVAIELLGRDTRFVFRQMRESVLFFLDIREAVQENFFGPIRDALEDLDTGPLSTVFAAGFGGVAAAAGRFVASFIELFEHPEAARFFQDVFRLAELTFDEVGGAIIELIGAFTNMANATIPDVERGVKSVGDTIRGWADSLNEFVDSGDFRNWLDDAQAKLAVITDLLGGFWDLILTIVNGTEEDIGVILNQIDGIITRLTEFFRTESGQTALEGMRITLEIMLVVLNLMAAAWGSIFLIIGAIGRFLDAVLLGNMEDFERLVREIDDGIFGVNNNFQRTRTAIGEIIFAIGKLLVPALRDQVAGAILLITQRWQGVGTRIAGALELALGLADATRGDLVSAAARLTTGWAKVTGAIAGADREGRQLRSATSSTNANLLAARDRAWQLRDALAAAAAQSARISTSGVTGGRNIPVAEGGIFTTMQNVTIAEAGPEVVIPLTRPRRARELIEATNLMGLVQGGDGAIQFGSTRGTTGLGAAPQIHLTFVSDGSRAGAAMLEMIRHGVRIQGGNVQTVLGSGRVSVDG